MSHVGRFCGMLVLWLCAAGPAQAALDRAALSQVGIHATQGAQLPLDTVLVADDQTRTLRDWLGGKPALLVFVDYRCRQLCGIVLDRLADVLPGVPLRLGRDYTVIAVALDERQTQHDAQAFRDRHVGGTALATAGVFATETREAKDAIARSVGLDAPYDSEHERFAHPAAVLAIDAGGRLRAVLSPLAIDARDIELALLQNGTAPSLASHILQLCYGFNPATGMYDVRVQRVLAGAAALTIVLMLAGLAMLVALERHAGRRDDRA